MWSFSETRSSPSVHCFLSRDTRGHSGWNIVFSLQNFRSISIRAAFTRSRRNLALGSSLLMKTNGRESGLDEISDWEWRAQQARYRVKGLALSCECTPRQLERYFARRFAITPHSWMDQLRLRDVRARLHSGELPKNITQEVGFAHAPQLSFWCKRVSGH